MPPTTFTLLSPLPPDDQIPKDVHEIHQRLAEKTRRYVAVAGPLDDIELAHIEADGMTPENWLRDMAQQRGVLHSWDQAGLNSPPGTQVEGDDLPDDDDFGERIDLAPKAKRPAKPGAMKLTFR